jgi:hypothetical protein
LDWYELMHRFFMSAGIVPHGCDHKSAGALKWWKTGVPPLPGVGIFGL